MKGDVEGCYDAALLCSKDPGGPVRTSFGLLVVQPRRVYSLHFLLNPSSL